MLTRRLFKVLYLVLACMALAAPIFGEEAPAAAAGAVQEAPDLGAYALDNFFVFICAVLVIFMQPGFAILESGLNAAKNTVNILTKNVIDLALGALVFFLVGFSFMYGEGIAGFIGFSGFGIAEALGDAPGAGVLHPQITFLFQVAFAATAATIVSGAVAGRLKFPAYLVYTVVLTGLVYPISGFWTWGGGWLKEMGFHDFAGSLIVHAVGGFAGLAGAIVLGARRGRFGKDGKPRAMPGHNISLSALGVFILLVGWFGFNPGSQVAMAGVENVAAVGTIAVNTLLAAGAGGVIALVMAWIFFGKPDLTMALNGVLGGLVGITANCDIVTNGSAVLIGAIAGVLVFLGVKLLDSLRIDDPVGAWPVHGLCGVWGGLAAAIFGPADFSTQLIGSLAIAGWAFATLFLVFFVMKKLGILRVSAEEETRGLDIGEHGMEAYPDFQGFLTK